MKSSLKATCAIGAFVLVVAIWAALLALILHLPLSYSEEQQAQLFTSAPPDGSTLTIQGVRPLLGENPRLFLYETTLVSKQGIHGYGQVGFVWDIVKTVNHRRYQERIQLLTAQGRTEAWCENDGLYRSCSKAVSIGPVITWSSDQFEGRPFFVQPPPPAE